jgi:hypothetical protein
MSWVGKLATDFGNTPTDGPDGGELSCAGAPAPPVRIERRPAQLNSAPPVAAASGVAT